MQGPPRIRHKQAQRAAYESYDTTSSLPTSRFAVDLQQDAPGRDLSNPASWVCASGSGATLRDGLWLNLSTGYIGSGRRSVWREVNGARILCTIPGDAFRHFTELKAKQGRVCPLVVKLGTISADGAEVFCYEEDRFVSDPKLAEHLRHWHIDMSNMTSTATTVPSTKDLELEANLEAWGDNADKEDQEASAQLSDSMGLLNVYPRPPKQAGQDVYRVLVQWLRLAFAPVTFVLVMAPSIVILATFGLGFGLCYGAAKLIACCARQQRNYQCANCCWRGCYPSLVRRSIAFLLALLREMAKVSLELLGWLFCNIFYVVGLLILAAHRCDVERTLTEGRKCGALADVELWGPSLAYAIGSLFYVLTDDRGSVVEWVLHEVPFAQRARGALMQGCDCARAAWRLVYGTRLRRHKTSAVRVAPLASELDTTSSSSSSSKALTRPTTTTTSSSRHRRRRRAAGLRAGVDGDEDDVVRVHPDVVAVLKNRSVAAYVSHFSARRTHCGGYSIANILLNRDDDFAGNAQLMVFRAEFHPKSENFRQCADALGNWKWIGLRTRLPRRGASLAAPRPPYTWRHAEEEDVWFTADTPLVLNPEYELGTYFWTLPSQTTTTTTASGGLVKAAPMNRACHEMYAGAGGIMYCGRWAPELRRRCGPTDGPQCDNCRDGVVDAGTNLFRVEELSRRKEYDQLRAELRMFAPPHHADGDGVVDFKRNSESETKLVVRQGGPASHRHDPKAVAGAGAGAGAVDDNEQVRRQLLIHARALRVNRAHAERVAAEMLQRCYKRGDYQQVVRRHLSGGEYRDVEWSEPHRRWSYSVQHTLTGEWLTSFDGSFNAAGYPMPVLARSSDGTPLRLCCGRSGVKLHLAEAEAGLGTRSQTGTCGLADGTVCVECHAGSVAKFSASALSSSSASAPYLDSHVRRRLTAAMGRGNVVSASKAADAVVSVLGFKEAWDAKQSRAEHVRKLAELQTSGKNSAAGGGGGSSSSSSNSSSSTEDATGTGAATATGAIAANSAPPRSAEDEANRALAQVIDLILTQGESSRNKDCCSNMCGLAQSGLFFWEDTTKAEAAVRAIGRALEHPWTRQSIQSFGSVFDIPMGELQRRILKELGKPRAQRFLPPDAPSTHGNAPRVLFWPSFWRNLAHGTTVNGAEAVMQCMYQAQLPSVGDATLLNAVDVACKLIALAVCAVPTAFRAADGTLGAMTVVEHAVAILVAVSSFFWLAQGANLLSKTVLAHALLFKRSIATLLVMLSDNGRRTFLIGLPPMDFRRPRTVLFVQKYTAFTLQMLGLRDGVINVAMAFSGAISIAALAGAYFAANTNQGLAQAGTCGALLSICYIANFVLVILLGAGNNAAIDKLPVAVHKLEHTLMAADVMSRATDRSGRRTFGAASSLDGHDLEELAFAQSLLLQTRTYLSFGPISAFRFKLVGVDVNYSLLNVLATVMSIVVAHTIGGVTSSRLFIYAQQSLAHHVAGGTNSSAANATMI